MLLWINPKIINCSGKILKLDPKSVEISQSIFTFVRDYIKNVEQSMLQIKISNPFDLNRKNENSSLSQKSQTLAHLRSKKMLWSRRNGALIVKRRYVRAEDLSSSNKIKILRVHWTMGSQLLYNETCESLKESLRNIINLSSSIIFIHLFINEWRLEIVDVLHNFIE